MMNSKEKACLIKECIEDKKAVDLIVLEMKQFTFLTDYFIICSGTSEIHVLAIAEGIEEGLMKERIKINHCEGINKKAALTTGIWVLLDCDDVVIHIFSEGMRKFYDLENLWGDAPRLVC